ncbi:MAG: LuxR C-terminal-related transcriptional regulator, partial [Actinomycetota bacterium]|nr:LuxR C-terminal-related transcriptional regulator [Actinomycetota bacterium]
VLAGRAVDAATPVPFRPLFEALAGWSRDGGPNAHPELVGVREVLAPILPAWRPAENPAYPVSAMELGDALLRLLTAIAGDRGCVLVLEDLHWADPDTAAVLEYVVDNLSGSGVLCVVTARSEGSGDALRVIRALASRRAVTLLELPRLGGDDLAAMVRSCLRTDELPDEVDALVRSFSDGVPFLVEELLASSVASGSLVDGPEGWHVQGEAGPVLPQGFEELVRRRVEALSDADAQVLLAAAVLGPRFDAELLPAITGRSVDEVVAALRSGVAAQLLIADPAEPGSFALRHALTRDALLAQLLPIERTALARGVLAALEQHDPELPGDLTELAASLAEQVGDGHRAAELLLVAARRAVTRGALSSAEPVLDRAWRLVRRDDPVWPEVGRELMGVLTETGNIDRALEVGGRLLADLPPTADRAAIHLAMAHAALAAGRTASAMELLDRARVAATEDRAAGVAADADVIAASIAAEQHRYDEADRLATGALAVTDPATDPARACQALLVLGRCLRVHRRDEAAEHFDRAISIADAHGLTALRLRAVMDRAWFEIGSFGDGRLMSAARDEAAAAGALVVAAHLDNLLAWLAIDHRDPDRANFAAERGAAIARKLQLGPLEGMLLGGSVMAAAQQGDRALMERRAAEAAAVASDRTNLAIIEAWARAELVLPRDDLPRLHAELSATMELLRAAPQFPIPARGLFVLLSALLDRDAEAALAELRADLAFHQAINRAHWHYANAILLGRAGDHAGAAGEVAEGDAAATPLAWFQHHARRLVAEAAIADSWGEPAEWLRDALTAFEGRGEDDLAASCRRLLAKAGVPVPRKASTSDGVPVDLQAKGITARELEVLVLLAEAMPTREMAERLFLSPRTVERHISNIAVKVGVPGRAGVVAFAAARLAAPAS